MYTSWTSVRASAFGPIVALVAIGCQPSAPTGRPQAEHEHAQEHDHPETLAATMAEIKRLRDSIQETFESGDPKDADDKLHEVGHLLEHLSDLIGQASLPAEAEAKIKKASDELWDAFGKLDVFHGGDHVEEVAYHDVADTIESNIKTIEQFMGEDDTAEHEHGNDADDESGD